jgi:hypothetical protein
MEECVSDFARILLQVLDRMPDRDKGHLDSQLKQNVFLIFIKKYT